MHDVEIEDFFNVCKSINPHNVCGICGQKVSSVQVNPPPHVLSQGNVMF